MTSILIYSPAKIYMRMQKDALEYVSGTLNYSRVVREICVHSGAVGRVRVLSGHDVTCCRQVSEATHVRNV